MFGTRRQGAMALVMVVVVWVFGGVRSAAAQGQAFPPPLSTEALERGLGRYVRPSPEAMTRIHAAHDRYMNDFRTLESAELEAFAAERPPMMTGGDMGQWMRKYEQLRGRIMALDAGLLAEAAQAVSEDQRSGVERIRWVREVQVLRSGFLSEIGAAFGGGSRVDLGDLLYGSELQEQDLAKIDPLLREHQSRLLGTVRKSSGETERLIMELTDRMQKEGLWGPAMMEAQKDPEAAAKMFEKMSAIMRDTFGGIALAHGKIGEVNRRSYREMREQLSFEGRLKTSPRWLESAYPQLAGQFPQGLVQFARRAQSMPGVGADAKQAIEDILEESIRRVIASLDNAELLVEQQALAAVMAQFSREEGASRTEQFQAQQEAMRADAEARQKIVESAMGSIRAQLPAEIVEKLDEADPTQQGTINGLPTPIPVVGEAAADGEDEQEGAEDASVNAMSAFENGLPLDTFSTRITAYSVSDLKRLLGAIQATDAVVTMAESLHGDYLLQFKQSIDPARERHEQARVRIYQPTDGNSGFNAAQAAESWQALRAMVQSMQQVDGAFFDGLAAAVGEKNEPWVQLERLGRMTSTLGRVTARTWIYAPNSEQPVDVVAVLREAELEPSDRVLVMQAVLGHAPALNETSQKAFDASIEMTQQMERLQAEMFTGARTQEDQMRIAQEFQRRMQEISAASKPFTDARAAEQRVALDAAMESLSDSRRPLLQRSWTTASYPTLYRDPKALFSTIKKVESMGDLTEDQRNQVTIAATEYRDAYDLASDALMAASATPVPEANNQDAEYWLAIQTRERAIQRMKFERDETTARAASRLRQILTAEQLARFRNLTDPSKTSTKPVNPW